MTSSVLGYLYQSTQISKHLLEVGRANFSLPLMLTTCLLVKVPGDRHTGHKGNQPQNKANVEQGIATKTHGNTELNPDQTISDLYSTFELFDYINQYILFIV